MQVSISSITTPLHARTPGDLHQNFAPTVGLLHPSFCQGDGGREAGIYWDNSRGAGICL